MAERVGTDAVKDQLKMRMFEAQHGRCWICREPMLLDVSPNHPLFATYDHIVPVSLGGKWEESNLKLAHQFCNNRRGNGRQHTPVYVRREGAGHMPFCAAWLKDKGYMEAPQRLQAADHDSV
jgi:5-methylcytosine-specific restriction endonuclease McrA